MSPFRQRIDRLRQGENSPRAPWLVLAGAMALASGFILYYGRDGWFSIDEAQWISDSPQLDLGGALSPTSGIWSSFRGWSTS